MSTAPRTNAAPNHRPACYACFKPKVACICATVERVANRTGIIILQHPRERFHAVGTTRIARLGFDQIRVESLTPWADSAAIRARLPERTALLYPAPGARELHELPADERPRHLVVIDGTWFHAKKIHDAHVWLHSLPHLRLTPGAPSRYRIRREPKPWCMATIEAIVDALRVLEPQTPGLDGLLRSFTEMIDRQAAFVTGQRDAPRRQGSATRRG